MRSPNWSISPGLILFSRNSPNADFGSLTPIWFIDWSSYILHETCRNQCLPLPKQWLWEGWKSSKVWNSVSSSCGFLFERVNVLLEAKVFQEWHFIKVFNGTIESFDSSDCSCRWLMTVHWLLWKQFENFLSPDLRRFWKVYCCLWSVHDAPFSNRLSFYASFHLCSPWIVKSIWSILCSEQHVNSVKWKDHAHARFYHQFSPFN